MKKFTLLPSDGDPWICGLKMGLELMRSERRHDNIHIPSNRITSEQLKFRVKTNNFQNLTAIKEYEPSTFQELRRFFNDTRNTLAAKQGGEKVELDIYESFLSTETVISCGELKNSGSRFFYSTDAKFLIKTLPHSQVKFLLRMLARYKQYMTLENPNSFLTRIHGLYRIRITGESQIVGCSGNRGKKGCRTKEKTMYLMIMENAMPPNSPTGNSQGLDVFDMKGFGLLHPRDNMDLKRWCSGGTRLPLDGSRVGSISESLKKDVDFLTNANVNDYSILLGVVKSNDQLPPPQYDSSVFIGLIDILSEWHCIRKAGFFVPGVFFPRFMIPSRYGKRMMTTIDTVFK